MCSLSWYDDQCAPNSPISQISLVLQIILQLIPTQSTHHQTVWLNHETCRFDSNWHHFGFVGLLLYWVYNYYIYLI